MACDLTLGRGIKCKDSVGGIDAIYFINDGDLGTITYNGTNTDSIDTIDGTQHAFHYDVKNSGSTLVETMTSSRENGTTFVDQTLTLVFPNLTVADHKELKLLAWGNPKVIVRDNNGDYKLCGLEFGMDVETVAAQSGGAMGDLSGYTITLKGMEKTFANYFDDTVEATLATSCNLIIVKAGGVFVS